VEEVVVRVERHRDDVVRGRKRSRAVWRRLVAGIIMAIEV